MIQIKIPNITRATQIKTPTNDRPFRLIVTRKVITVNKKLTNGTIHGTVRDRAARKRLSKTHPNETVPTLPHQIQIPSQEADRALDLLIRLKARTVVPVRILVDLIHVRLIDIPRLKTRTRTKNRPTDNESWTRKPSNLLNNKQTR